MGERQVLLSIALAALGALLATGCDGAALFGSGSASGAASGAAGSGKTGAAATATATVLRDDTPPTWLPPGYTEIPWERAVALVKAREVDRVIGTETRRAYVVERTGAEHFTIEPRSGALKALLADVERGAFLMGRSEEIPWKEAEAILRERRATSIMAAHFRMVYVGVKGGGSFMAVVPASIDLGRLVKEADPSLDITVE